MRAIILLETENGKLTEQSLKALGASRFFKRVDAIVFDCEGEDIRRLEPLSLIYKVKTGVNRLTADSVVPTIAEIVKEYDVVFAAHSTWSKAALARLAMRLKRPILTAVSEIKEGILKRSFFAGHLQAEYSVDEPFIMTLRADSYKQMGEQAPAAVEDVPFVSPEVTNKSVAYEKSQGERPHLAHAKRVVAGGQSVGSDFTPLEDLADVMGAAVGATRAAADLGYVPYDWQIGQSGHLITPDVYLGLGISGAAQHVCGIKNAKQIFVINKDPEAPIFKYADYALVADMFEVLPDLKRKLSDD